MSYKNRLVISMGNLAEFETIEQLINMGELVEFENIEQLNKEIQTLKDDFKYAVVTKNEKLFQIRYDHDCVQFWDSEKFINLLAKYLTKGNIYIDIIGEDGDRVAYDIYPKKYEIINWMPKVIEVHQLT